jgi:hypothetical protein
MRIRFYLIAILILLPSVSLSQEQSLTEKFRSTKEFQKVLSVFKEQQIVDAPNRNTEIYRIFITPTFYHPLSIRVEKSGNDYFLIAKRLSGQGGYGWGHSKTRRDAD